MSVNSLWVSYSSNAGGVYAGGIQCLNPATMAVLGSIAAPEDRTHPGAGLTEQWTRMQIAPDRSKVYVAGTNTIYRVDTATLAVDYYTLDWYYFTQHSSDPTATPPDSYNYNYPGLPQFVVSPDSSELWVPYYINGGGGGTPSFAGRNPPSGEKPYCNFVVAAGNAIQYFWARISAATGAYLGRFLVNPLTSSALIADIDAYPSVDARPNRGIVFSPDGTKGYFSQTSLYRTAPRTVGVLDVASMTVTATLNPMPSSAANGSIYQLAVTADGAELLGVATQSGATPAPFLFRTSLPGGAVAARQALVPSADGWGAYSPQLDADPTGADTAKPGYVATNVVRGGNTYGLISNVNTATASHTAADITAFTDALIAAPKDIRVFADSVAGINVYTTVGSSVYKLAVGSLATVGTASLPATGYDVLFGPPFAAQIGTSLGAAMIACDGHRRPAAVTAGTTVGYATSRDGGHTFDAYTAVAAPAKSASLWIDPRTNRPRVLWDDGSTLTVARASKDGEQGDWS